MSRVKTKDWMVYKEEMRREAEEAVLDLPFASG